MKNWLAANGMRVFACLSLSMGTGQGDELKWQWEGQASGVEMSIRALCAVDEMTCWFGTGKGTIGRTSDGGKTWKLFVVKGAEELEFRDVEAFDAERCLAMSVGEGGASRIYRTVDGGKNWKLVFQNEAAEGFFDGMAFWDEKNGILAGDPVDGRLVILKTSDGGESWKAIEETPKMKEGEHAFAASGTHLTVAPGRHFAVLDLIDDVLKELEFLEAIVQRVDLVKSDTAFLFVRSVAGNAVLFEDGLDLIREVIGPGGREDREKNQEGGEKVHDERIRGGGGGCIRRDAAWRGRGIW